MMQECNSTVRNRPDTEALVQGNAAFALDLYGELKKSEGNLFFAPYSISAALAMTYAGARENTAAQMAQTLHFTLDPRRLHPAFAALEAELNAVQKQGNVLLKIANSLWPQAGYPFLEEFLALTKEYYGATITPLDYGDPETARETINAWVGEHTEGKIKELIGPRVLGALTRLVLTNAIYFKGNWASRFDPALTEDAPFWVTPARQVPVPMMTQQREFKYAECAGVQILELPYAGHDLAMIVLLPRQADGLATLEDALSVESLTQWTRAVWEREVVVFLPRFKASSKFDLKDTLESLGMADAFDADEANFSGMDGVERWLYISAVLHQAFVDVNEEGTEAAAATAVIMAAMGLPASPPAFRADHPFIFLIRDNRTGSILFLGRVVDPAAEAA